MRELVSVYKREQPGDVQRATVAPKVRSSFKILVKELLISISTITLYSLTLSSYVFHEHQNIVAHDMHTVCMR